MLSKLATRNILGRTRAAILLPSQRTFSSDLATTDAAVLKKGHNHMTLFEYSAQQAAMRAQTAADEASYLSDLKQSYVDKSSFKKVAINEDDHHTVKQIKTKINTIVEQELALVDFKAHVDQEDLAADTFAEVITRKNFFFEIDQNKVHKNLRVTSMDAPGNKFRKPNYILPHEHVPMMNHMNVAELTEDKLLDMYAYYSYMIDMHIAKIRPENLDEKSYIPSRFNQEGLTEKVNEHLQNQFFDFYHRWREPTRTWFSQTQEIDYQEYLKNRPTTTHYDHDRGDKYEVDWSDDDKFPHVASRLGYPMLREEPIEKIIGWERAPAHPGYQFQPFVQTPSMSPDPTLNFEEGETIYENRNVLEWTRFWKVSLLSTLGFFPGFYVFEMYAADGLPSLQWVSENFNWWQIPRQFQDGGDWDLKNYRYCDDHDYMNMQYGGKRAFARPCHTAYCLQLMVLLQHMNFDYVSKMVYNKDKDVVFVYKPDGFWWDRQYVHEMHHLEQMVPFAVTAVKHLSANQDNGIITVYDMAQKEQLRFYSEDKYWNQDVKDEFMYETQNLWRGQFSSAKHGSIFKLTTEASEEEALVQMKVERELQDAIAKHGEATRPSLFEDEVKERILNRKREIVAAL